jgi:hypothetical protein
VPVLFRTGSAPGIYPSEASPPGRYPRRFRREAPTYRSALRFTRRPEAPDRPERPRFLGFDPSESPWRPCGGLIRRSLDPPLGSTLPGFARKGLGRSFPRPPLARFAGSAASRRTHRRPRVSIGLYLAPSKNRTEVRKPDRATLIGFPHQSAPEHSSEPYPGYEFTFHRAAHRCQLPDSLWIGSSLYRS